jgi:hypothetical protein
MGAAGHSPNRGALATRKTCQNDEFPDIRRGLKVLLGHVDIAPARPYLCRNVSAAMAFILLAFLPLNLGMPVSHSFGG